MADIGRVDAIIDKWNADPEFVIEMLQDIQDQFRHIPRKALERVADRTGRPRGKLFHIATFYKAFSLEPRGEIEIQVCMGTACYVKGAPDILAALEREMGVSSGETTPDGRFTISEVRCLGCCGIAPVISIDDEIISEVKPSEVHSILSSLEDS